MAAKAERSIANVIALFGTQPEVEEEEIPVGIALKGNASPQATASTVSGLLDLTGKPKVWLTIGRAKRARRH